MFKSLLPFNFSSCLKISTRLSSGLEVKQLSSISGKSAISRLDRYWLALLRVEKLPPAQSSTTISRTSFLATQSVALVRDSAMTSLDAPAPFIEFLNQFACEYGFNNRLGIQLKLMGGIFRYETMLLFKNNVSLFVHYRETMIICLQITELA